LFNSPYGPGTLPLSSSGTDKLLHLDQTQTLQDLSNLLTCGFSSDRDDHRAAWQVGECCGWQHRSAMDALPKATGMEFDDM
jgi:hypothetical protein